MGFDDGIEEENVGILGLGKDAIGIGNLVESGANGDEMGEDLIGLMKAMAEEMGVDLSEMGSGFMAVKKTEDFALDLETVLVHVIQNAKSIQKRKELKQKKK